MYRIRFTKPEQLPGDSHRDAINLGLGYTQAQARRALADFKADTVYSQCGPVLEVSHGDHSDYVAVYAEEKGA